MMVGKPGEGKPRHSISLDLPVVPDLEWRGLPSPGYLSLDRPVVPDLEWRGLPSPGSPTASSRLVHVFEWYWPQAAAHPAREWVRAVQPAAAQPAPTPYPWRTAGGSEESNSGET